MDVTVSDQEKLESWHRHELIRLEFTSHQRAKLLWLMEKGELDLADVRDLIEKRHWTPEQAFLAVA